jgi:CheY-like chemotaxis protein
MRVLIVDDEPSIRKTTRSALETAGYSAAEAATAARALKAVADEAFDVVFIDLDLGADNGLETLGRLLQARPAPASGSRSRARSSWRTAAASLARANPARAQIFIFCCRGDRSGRKDSCGGLTPHRDRTRRWLGLACRSLR